MKELIALAFAAALAVFLVWAMHSEGRDEKERRKRLLSLFSGIFPGLTSCSLHRMPTTQYGIYGFSFVHAGLKGMIHFGSMLHNVRSGPHPGEVRFRLSPPLNRQGLLAFLGLKGPSLSIKVRTGFLDKRRLSELSDEEFFARCRVRLGRRTFPGTALPRRTAALLKRLSLCCNHRLSASLGPRCFQIQTDGETYARSSTEDFFTACLLLFRELVFVPLADDPSHPWNMSETYGSVDFTQDRYLPPVLRRYINVKFPPARRGYGTDPVGRFVKLGPDSDADVYDTVGFDVGDVILNNAHALSDGSVPPPDSMGQRSACADADALKDDARSLNDASAHASIPVAALGSGSLGEGDLRGEKVQAQPDKVRRR